MPAALAAPAQAQPRSAIAITAPRGEASGSILFAASGVGSVARKVVFKVDNKRVWTTTKHPFRYRRSGMLNTRRLRNGTHTLIVQAFYHHGQALTARRRITVHNVDRPRPPKRHQPGPGTGPTHPTGPTGPTGPRNVGVTGPPAGGVTGPAPVMFNRTSYRFSTLLPIAQEASRYQVMTLQVTNAAEVPKLHAANPGLKILMYTDPTLSKGNNTLTTCTSYTGDLANHPSWFLRDQSGNVIPTGTSPNYLMDPANPGYQQACMSTAIATAKQYGFDGVFFDGLGATLRWVLPAGTTIPQYPTDASYQGAVTSMLTYAGQAMHANGLIVFGNICGSTLTPGLWQQWTAPLDGAEEESWTDGGLGLAQQVPNWRAKLAAIDWSEANGKYTILHSYNTTEAGNTYGMASMMLVGGGHTSYSVSNADYTSSESWYPEYDTAQSLGAAAGPYKQLADGVYERVFANGIVLVNPTASTVPNFALGGGTYSGSGVTNATSATMAPTSALILKGG
jgi:Hypothetical glycosyl hydrolase family 15